MKITDEEAHRQLYQMAQDHVDEPDDADAEQNASNNVLLDSPLMASALPSAPPEKTAPRPGSIQVQTSKLVTRATPPTPKLDLSQPIGYSAPKQDTELRGLQDDAKSRRSMSQLGQSVTDFTERPTNFLDYAQRLGGGGVSAAPAKNKMWEQNAEEGDRAISDLEQRRKSDGAMASSAEDHDPNSQTAQTYRSVLVKFAPDLAEKLRGASPKQMLAIAPWLEKFSHDNAEALKASAAAATKAKEDEAKQPLVDAQLKKLQNENGAFDDNQAGKKSKAELDAEYERARMDAERARTEAAKKKGHGGPPVDDDASVAAVANGQVAVSKKQKDSPAFMAKVYKLKPDYNEATALAYRHTLENQSTNASLNAGQAVRHHIDLLKEAVNELPEGSVDTPWFNSASQAWDESTGGGKYTKLKTAASVVASELAQALGDKDVTGREHVAHLVRPNQTKKQWAQSIPELEKLRDEKLGVFEKTLQNLAPKPHAPAAGGSVRMRGHDGQVHDIPQEMVHAAETDSDEPLVRVQ